MSVLRRPDDHRRNLRRRAPCAFFSADPHQDRHLMTVAALPAAQLRSAPLPAASRTARVLPSQPPQTLSKRRAHPRPSYARDRKPSSSSFPSMTRGATGPQSPTSAPSATPNPHRSRQPNRPPSSPRFPPDEAFGRRPRVQTRASAKGRRPKPFSTADGRSRRRAVRAGRGRGRHSWGGAKLRVLLGRVMAKAARGRGY
jgi:hypothetical protein